MKFPINEAKFVEEYMKGLNTPDETDEDFAKAIVAALNRAYATGYEDASQQIKTA